VSISQITPLSTYGIGTTYPPTASKLYQSTKTSAISAPKAYDVELSDSAQVRSLKLQGFSALLIATKMGLDINTVNLYLGSTESAANVTTTPTYIPPKEVYSEPKTIAESRYQLAQDLSQLTIARFTWSNIMFKQLTGNTKATTPETGLTLFTLKPAYDEFSLFKT
jgi:hypothetical protein